MVMDDSTSLSNIPDQSITAAPTRIMEGNDETGS